MRYVIHAAQLTLLPLLFVQGNLLAQGPTLDQDLRTLEGAWHTVKSPLSLEVTFKVVRKEGRAVEQIAIWFIDGPVVRKVNGKLIAGRILKDVNLPFKLKENGKRRAIEMPTAEDKESGFPRFVYYKLDGGILVLSIESGDFKGEYKFERTR